MFPNSSVRFAGPIAAVAFALLFLISDLGASARAAGQTTGTPQSLPTSDLIVETAAGDQHQFTIELADSPGEHSIGLMHRTEMAADHGMLFEYLYPQRVGFWMKNTHIPLDIIYVRQDGTIANIHAMTEPFSLDPLPSRGRVVSVLEINGGLAAELGIGPGDIVRHPTLHNWAVADEDGAEGSAQK